MPAYNFLLLKCMSIHTSLKTMTNTGLTHCWFAMRSKSNWQYVY